MGNQAVYAYDVESYPNFFSAIFINLRNLADIHTFVLFEDDITANSELIAFMGQSNLTLVGHNSLDYDDLMLRAIKLFPQIKANQLYRLTKRLIDGERSERNDIPHYYDLAYPKTPDWVSIDTLALTRVNKIRVGLKHAGVVLRHERLRDLPLPPGTIIQPDQIEMLLNYNVNDVLITIKFYKELLPLIEMRQNISGVFGVDIITANDTEIAKEILLERYSKAVGMSPSAVRKLRTERGTLRVGDCIGADIVFKTTELQNQLEILKQKWLHPANYYKYQLVLEFGGVVYNIGVGGLHSVDPPRILLTTDTHVIRDADVTSYYPMIALKNNFFPEHLGTVYATLYGEIVDERVQAKAQYKLTGDKRFDIVQAGLKIAINSGFGLMNNPYSWLYDPKALISITISGQLYLLDLIEKLHLAGIQTVSANTDGIVCQIPREKEDEYHTICAAWSARTGFTLEYADYTKLIQRDVNNYLTLQPNGKVKTKGVFQNDAGFRYDFGNGWGFYNTSAYNYAATGTLPDNIEKHRMIPGFAKGYSAPIVTIALYQYFVHGIAPEETIRNHWDITDFCISQRANIEKFDVVTVTVDDFGALTYEEQQKTNRYVVTWPGHGISVYKSHKLGGKDTAMLAGQHTLLLNDIDTYAASEYNINYDWYVKQVWSVIDQIDPPIISLF